MPTVFRVQKQKHNPTILTGEGAAITGNRWNYKGTPLVYTSTSASLAAWELRVHLAGLPLWAYPPFNIAVLEIPDECIYEFAETDLPLGWNNIDTIEICQAFLSPHIVAGNWLAYSVPSVVIPSECNILINPKHSDISRVRIQRFIPFQYDSRLK